MLPAVFFTSHHKALLSVVLFNGGVHRQYNNTVDLSITSQSLDEYKANVDYIVANDVFSHVYTDAILSTMAATAALPDIAAMNASLWNLSASTCIGTPFQRLVSSITWVAVVSLRMRVRYQEG